MSRPKLNSSLAIAEILGTQGYTDHVASMVTKHALIRATQWQRRQFKRNKAMFSEMVQAKLTEADKQILGKFISVKLAMSFDVGLRMGLTAFLHLSEAERLAFVLDVEDYTDGGDQ